MKAIFITGTDTGVGKTIVTGLLGRYLLDNGCSVITQKWIETGTSGFSKDIDMHLKLMGRKRRDIKDYLPFVCLYTFKFASSPHLAARLENKTITARRIKKAFGLLKRKHDLTIVEGTGGTLVPFNKKRLVIDIAKELGLPVLIVAENRLGAINHTLLTVEAVKKRGMKIVGIIFNNIEKGRDKEILKDNVDIVRALTGERVLGVLTRTKDKKKLYKEFCAIARRVSIHRSMAA